MRRGAAKGTLPFDLSVSDPKERIQAYLDIYQDPDYVVRLTKINSFNSVPDSQYAAGFRGDNNAVYASCFGEENPY
jgi:hypothetical protein